MGLRERLLATPLAERLELDREHRLLFINFEGLSVDSATTSTPSRPRSRRCWRRWDERVAVVVNYDSFSILPPLLDAYTAMVQRLTERFYSRVTRYGTGGFLKARLERRADR